MKKAHRKRAVTIPPTIQAIAATRSNLVTMKWVPHIPRIAYGECCLVTAVPTTSYGVYSPWSAFRRITGIYELVGWNDRQTDVGAVLGMTLEALISEYCGEGSWG